MCKASVVLVVVALLCLSVSAQADVFNLGPGLRDLETVLVDDPGNVGELCGSSAGGIGPDRMCGAVSYEFYMGMYEVTAAQYTDFLNHKAATDPYGLYTANMWTHPEGCKIERLGDDGSYNYRVASDWASRPVNFVSFWDACRFTNWLHNGQGAGSMENGAYPLNGYNGVDGRDIVRSPGARWFVPSEDEWYKAAYYRAGGTNAGYYDYATRSDTAPSNQVVDPDPGNNANYRASGVYSIGAPYYRTDAGRFTDSRSAYGAYDQTGNIAEWNDSFFDTGAPRVIRGGGYHQSANYVRSTYSNSFSGPAQESQYYGFRVASAVPEPSSLIVLAGGLGSLLALRRRRIG